MSLTPVRLVPTEPSKKWLLRLPYFLFKQAATKLMLLERLRWLPKQPTFCLSSPCGCNHPLAEGYKSGAKKWLPRLPYFSFKQAATKLMLLQRLRWLPKQPTFCLPSPCGRNHPLAEGYKSGAKKWLLRLPYFSFKQAATKLMLLQRLRWLPKQPCFFDHPLAEGSSSSR